VFPTGRSHMQSGCTLSFEIGTLCIYPSLRWSGRLPSLFFFFLSFCYNVEQRCCMHLLNRERKISRIPLIHVVLSVLRTLSTPRSRIFPFAARVTYSHVALLPYFHSSLPTRNKSDDRQLKPMFHFNLNAAHVVSPSIP
jgi:hypothetical protein